MSQSHGVLVFEDFRASSLDEQHFHWPFGLVPDGKFVLQITP